MRWSEEFDIIQEEMRRVLAWFEWRATWWENLVSIGQGGDPDIVDGSSAYAFKQAHLAHHIAARCAADWLPELNKQGIQPEWAGGYANIIKKKERSNPANVEDVLPEDVLDDDEILDFDETTSDAEEDEDEFDDFDDFEFDD